MRTNTPRPAAATVVGLLSLVLPFVGMIGANLVFPGGLLGGHGTAWLWFSYCLNFAIFFGLAHIILGLFPRRRPITVGRKPDGKMKSKTLYGKTRGAVSEALKKALRDQQTGLDIDPERQTVAVFMTRWLRTVVAIKNRPRTATSYEWLVKMHIKPHIGKIILEKLTPQQVREFLAERYASGLSAGTIKHMRAALRSALSHAEREGLVHRNVAKLVVVPKGERFQAKVFTVDQAREFLKVAVVSKFGPLFVVALSTGLRKGELLALRRQDIDFEENTLRVRHAIERRKGEGLVLSQPKSERSQRALQLPAITVKALREQQERQAATRHWAGSKWKERGFVFTTGLGTALVPESVDVELAAILKAAKLPPLRVHDLRHSAAVLLLSQGVHIKLISETLGHSSISLTGNTYLQVLPAMRNEVASRMNDVFGVSEGVNQDSEKPQ